jgi:phytanoyl-CoA hydroxylase
VVNTQQWKSFDETGILHLGRVLSDEDLKAMQDRLDAIMLGTADIDYSRLLMQLDSPDGAYEHAGEQSNGHKGATLAYRKLQNLEIDPIFKQYLARPIFREVNAHIYGPETPIGIFRTMFMNKPARQGTLLPWHQDRWTALDRDPLVTIWTALDPATRANGCVEVIPGSHKNGLVNPDHPSGFLTPEQAEAWQSQSGTEFIELEPGEAVVLHNWVLHRSDVNATDIPRRALSVCYMDGRTNGGEFPLAWE